MVYPKEIELLAPGGDIDSIKAAIVAGADAVYCGLNNFNARNRAENIEFENLNGILNLARQYNCKVFLTLNIIIIPEEFPTLINLLNRLVNTKIDGLIVQDLGLFYLLSEYFKDFKIHASTQVTTHNPGQVKFLSKLNCTRVNLSRELNINEIRDLTINCHENNIAAEVFVHGSYCIGFSGICYMSSFLSGKSGNRGRCSQPCRDRYLPSSENKNFPLNLKDNSAYSNLQDLIDAEVDSLKIEGRIKNFDYVYTVVDCYKNQLISILEQNKPLYDDKQLYKVFNRSFSNGYLMGNINKDMFIDNPRDNSIKRFAGIDDKSENKKLLQEKQEYYKEKDNIIANVKKKIQQLSIDKIPLIINISGKLDSPFQVIVKTPVTSFVVKSELNLVMKNKQSTFQEFSCDNLLKRLKSLNNTEYYIKQLVIKDLGKDLFIPFQEFTLIKKRILFILNGSKKIIDPIKVPVIRKQNSLNKNPELCVLISSKKDINLCNKVSGDIIFELPNCFKDKGNKFIDIFLENKKIIPWFPSILLGENYYAGINILKKLNPELIITNNTGIAHEAWKMGINWIAGPYLNLINSYGLLCLKEKFDCKGGFISNEISKKQIRKIICPDDFKLYYSIYHPVLLMTTRQCLFHQVTGCKKQLIDEKCIQTCNKSASISDLKGNTLYLKKTKGNYHCIYNSHNYLNTDILGDFPGSFSKFCIDLRDINTETNVNCDKIAIIKLFDNFLKGGSNAKQELEQAIYPFTNVQYKKGI